MNDPIDTTATEVESGDVDSGDIVTTIAPPTLELIDAKIDQCMAILLELVTWKTQLEEAMNEIQAKGIMGLMGNMGGLFGK